MEFFINIAVFFIGALAVGYTVALNGPEETPGQGLDFLTVMVRATVFAIGALFMFVAAAL